MIRSLVKIEFVPVTGDPITLLDYDDGMRDHVRWPMQQGDFSAGAIGAEYAAGISLGNASFSPAWTRRVLHDTHHEAEAYCQDHPAAMPLGVQGKFRYSIQGGNVYEYHHARVLACVVARLRERKNGKEVTITEYRGACGKREVVSTATPEPEESTPGDVPSLVPDGGDAMPGHPPSVVVGDPPAGPDPLPLLWGVTLSGITDPSAANGNVPKTGLSSGYLVFTDADVTVQRTGGIWKIQGSGGKGFDGEAADYPWEVETWTPYGGATGTPAVSPVWAG
ncbi:hypothetical protein OVA24_16785 [Luteolibacter sp. SL250]|uniref:hypothetical protein n=1 Tax=Luteolibacter sp. SL250 TaxID=2995170 RepID=UPI00226E9E77|nr:hypothetical protein [Luteolibacter sp. SL250]WAC18889.1 hypothetical protein OVA24_16785 [Luteolibacter sp. SL250]